MAGQLNKIGFVIQARVGSQRLPGKVLYPLPFPGGEPVLGHIIHAVKKLEGTIIVATSINSENDDIEAYCKKVSVECFRGDETNVLSRFTEIQKQHNFDHIVRLTGDNPLLDDTILQKHLEYHIQHNFDYSGSKGLPVGMNFEVFKGSQLLLSQNLVESNSDLEHVTPVLRREKQFVRGVFEYSDEYKDLRLTIDSNVDFAQMNVLFSLKEEYGYSGIKLVEFAKEQYPWMLTINNQILQNNSAVTEAQEMFLAMETLKKLKFFKVAEILKDKI